MSRLVSQKVINMAQKVRCGLVRGSHKGEEIYKNQLCCIILSYCTEDIKWQLSLQVLNCGSLFELKPNFMQINATAAIFKVFRSYENFSINKDV